MTMTWRPSFLGKFFTRAEDWAVTIENGNALLTLGKHPTASPILLKEIQIIGGIFWGEITAKNKEDQAYQLKGIPNAQANAFRKVLTREELFARALQWLSTITNWVSNLHQTITTEHHRRGWISRDIRQQLELSRPAGFPKKWSTPEVVQLLKSRPEADQQALRLWRSDIRERIDAENQRHLARELVDSKAFFNSVEKSPLTEEQAKAVIWFDNRVLLVASVSAPV